MSKTKKNEKTKDTTEKIEPQHQDASSADENEEDEDFQEHLLLDDEDVRLLDKALKNYKPAPEEEQRYEILLEELDEILTRDLYMNMPD